MNIKQGKLYTCSKHYLLLYSDSTASTALAAPAIAAGTAFTTAALPPLLAAAAAQFWSNELKKPVSFCEPNTTLLILSSSSNFVEVLTGEGKKGWIIYREWLGIEQLMPKEKE